MFIAAGGGEQSSGRVMNILKFIEDCVGRAIEDAVAVVESGGYEMTKRVKGDCLCQNLNNHAHNHLEKLSQSMCTIFGLLVNA